MSVSEAAGVGAEAVRGVEHQARKGDVDVARAVAAQHDLVGLGVALDAQ